MNKQHILQNLTHLPKFAPMTPKNVYYINHTTRSDTMLKLIDLASKKQEFIIQTKCYHVNKYPAIIQILFTYELKLYIYHATILFYTVNCNNYFPLFFHYRTLFIHGLI